MGVSTTGRTTSLGVGEIEAIYRAEIGPLRRVARAITGDAESARDVVQDAFAAAITSRRSYRPTSSVEAWIWRIVVNRAISERRRQTRQSALPAVGEAPSANSWNGHATALMVAITRLPERQRLAVFLRYFADLGYDAIADILGISSGTVGASLHAARESLHAALESEEALT
jgi:RNA polymerase sigma-70 factor (ECF subfamily)